MWGDPGDHADDVITRLTHRLTALDDERGAIRSRHVTRLGTRRNRDVCWALGGGRGVAREVAEYETVRIRQEFTVREQRTISPTFRLQCNRTERHNV